MADSETVNRHIDSDPGSSPQPLALHEMLGHWLEDRDPGQGKEYVGDHGHVLIADSFYSCGNQLTCPWKLSLTTSWSTAVGSSL